MIDVNQLSFRYSSGKIALDNLSFQIHEGESIGFVGANGAGKTTLLMILAGIYNFKNGSIFIDELNLQNSLDRKKLPEKLGFIFQNSDDQLFHSTVEEDIAFGPINLNLPRAEVEKRVNEAIVQMNLSGLENRPPFQLSGGEKRRAAIAGILAMNPKIWLFDEPSIFLDARSRRELIGIIQNLPGTKLIASHDLLLIEKTCHRIIMMSEGKIIADGPAASILGNADLLYEYGVS